MPRTDLENFGNWTEEKTTKEPNRCSDCNTTAPSTQTNYTLISSRHGWRLSFATVNGRKVSVWRCPKCWAAHKSKKA